MKTIEVKLYSFEELTEEAKQKAIENLYDINISHDWWQFTYEDAGNIGLKLTGFELDRNRQAWGEFTLTACEVAQNIFDNHGETCETYKTAESFMEKWQPVFNEYMDESSEKYESFESENELIELEDEFLKDLTEDYSIMLQNESEYLQSEKSIIESIKANEYDFTEEGKLY